MFVVQRKSERQLTVESAEYCQIQGSNHLPGKRLANQTYYFEIDTLSNWQPVELMIAMIDVQESHTKRSHKLICMINMYVCHIDMQQDFSVASFSIRFCSILCKFLAQVLWCELLVQVCRTSIMGISKRISTRNLYQSHTALRSLHPKTPRWIKEGDF